MPVSWQIRVCELSAARERPDRGGDEVVIGARAQEARDARGGDVALGVGGHVREQRLLRQRGCELQLGMVAQPRRHRIEELARRPQTDALQHAADLVGRVRRIAHERERASM
jgi:hypothetical protein